VGCHNPDDLLCTTVRSAPSNDLLDSRVLCSSFPPSRTTADMRLPPVIRFRRRLLDRRTESLLQSPLCKAHARRLLCRFCPCDPRPRHSRHHHPRVESPILPHQSLLPVGHIGIQCNRRDCVCYEFPERFWRRTFDLFGGSHQIMHIMVVGAAVVHFFGLVRDFDHLRGAPLMCKP
jgi:Haemolysin-III related